MFKFFKKRDTWSVYKLESSTENLIIRLDNSYKNNISKSEHPIKMGIALKVQNQNKETEELKYKIEDYLNDYFNKDEIGFLVAIITGMQKDNMFIEFLSYIKKDSIDFPNFHEQLKKEFNLYDLQMYAEVENDWDTYKMFVRK